MPLRWSVSWQNARASSPEPIDEKAKALISVIKENPFQNPPPYEKLVGDLNGSYSRRINVQHRLVYDVFEEEQTIKILSLWTHYER